MRGRHRAGAHVEAAAADAVIGYLDAKEFARHPRRSMRSGEDIDVKKLTDGLARDRARIAEIEDRYADGELDRAQHRRMYDRV